MHRGAANLLTDSALDCNLDGANGTGALIDVRVSSGIECAGDRPAFSSDRFENSR